VIGLIAPRDAGLVSGSRKAEIPSFPMLKIYAYAKCGTCRKAVKFLRANSISFREIAIRETPPSKAELRAMLAAQDGQLRKLFNTAGGDYKSLGLSAKLPLLSDSEAIDLLASNGNLVKRPFVIGDGIHLAGFDEKAWRMALL
jgi:arsenate reductase